MKGRYGGIHPGNCHPPTPAPLSLLSKDAVMGPGSSRLSPAIARTTGGTGRSGAEPGTGRSGAEPGSWFAGAVMYMLPACELIFQKLGTIFL